MSRRGLLRRRRRTRDGCFVSCGCRRGRGFFLGRARGQHQGDGGQHRNQDDQFFHNVNCSYRNQLDASTFATATTYRELLFAVSLTRCVCVSIRGFSASARAAEGICVSFPFRGARSTRPVLLSRDARWPRTIFRAPACGFAPESASPARSR